LRELRGTAMAAAMAKNPLLATLLCLVFSPNPASLPVRRVELYERVLNGLLGEWAISAKRRLVDPDMIAAKLLLLEGIALHFFPGKELDGRTLNAFLWGDGEAPGYMTRLDADHPLRKKQRESTSGVVQALCADGVLVPSGGPSTSDYRFLHSTFQEYLVAGAIARRVEGSDARARATRIVDEKVGLPDWRDVFVLLAGRMKEPELLLDLLMNNTDATDDMDTVDDTTTGNREHRFVIAGLCLPELPPKIREREATLVDWVTAKVFEHLWSRGDWRVADLIPALSALVRAGGRVNGAPVVEWLSGVLTAAAVEHVETRIKAAEYLGWTGDDRAIQPLIEAFGDGEIEMWVMDGRRLSPLVFALLKLSDAAKPALIHALMHEDPHVFTWAETTLAFMCDIELLVEALTHQHWRVRGGAALALGAIASVGHEKALPALVRGLAREQDPHVREAFETALDTAVALSAGAEPGRRLGS
jgi:hypothetical protein